DANPRNAASRAFLAAAYALVGRDDEAREALAAFMDARPGSRVSTFRTQAPVPLVLTSKVYQQQLKRLSEGLRLAGMPEERAAAPACGILRPSPSGTGGSMAGELRMLLGVGALIGGLAVIGLASQLAQSGPAQGEAAPIVGHVLDLQGEWYLYPDGANAPSQR